MNHLQKIMVLSVFILCNHIARAQVWRNPSFTQYTTLEGLSQNNVKCILSDSKGYTWIGTQNGLNRFNGYGFEWKLFRHSINDPTTISDNFITSLFEDTQGNIWVASGKNHLNKYDANINQFIRYELPYENAVQKTAHIYQLDSSLFLLGTVQNGLFIWNKHKNNLNPINGLIGEEIHTIIAVQDKVYVASSNGLFEVDNSQSVSVSLLYENTVESAVKVGESVVFSSGNTIVIYKPETNESTVIAEKSISSFLQIKPALNKNLLWMISAEEELYFFNLETKELKRYPHENNLSNLPSILSCIEQDNLGNMWVGTIGSGVFLNYNRPVGFSNFLEGNKVWVINFDQDSNLWVGGSQGVGFYQLKKVRENAWQMLRQFDSKTQDKWRGDALMHHYFSDPDVYDIISSKRGGLWIGAENSLNYYEKESNKLITYQYSLADTSKKGDNKFWCLYEDKDTILWAGTYNGLKRFDWRTETFKAYRNNPQDSTSIGANMIWDIFSKNDRFIWLGTRHGGLNRFDKTNETFQRFFYNPYDENSLSMNTISDIVPDEKGNLWIATYGGGLNYFNTKNYRVTRFGPNEGLIDEGLLAMLLVGEYLWISTDLHLIRFHTTTKKFEYYDINDGLLPEYNLGAATEDENGNVYFGGIDGFTVVNPKKIGEQLELSIELTQIEFYESESFNESSFVKGFYTGFAKAIATPYNQNHLTVQWRTSRSNLSTQTCEVYYKLQNEDDWQKANVKGNTLPLPNLPVGEYNIEWKLKESRALIESNIISLRVAVSPPPFFLRESTQIVLVILLSLGLGFFFYRRREQKKLLDEQLKVKRLKVEQALVEKEQVLTAIQSRFAYTYHLYPNLMSSLLDHLRNGESQSAEKLIYELRDVFLAVTQKNVCWTLTEEMKLVENYLTLVQKRHEKLEVNYNYIDPEVAKIQTLVPVGIALEFIYNAVKYAFDGKKDSWCLTIDIIPLQTEFLLKITDNGRGVFATQKDKGSKIKKGTGQGIRVLKKWITVANEINRNKCKVEYTILGDEKDEFPGTKVTVQIPYQFNFLIEENNAKP